MSSPAASLPLPHPQTKAKVEDGRAHFEGLTLQTLLLDDVFLVATGSGLESGRGVPVLGGPPPLLPEERVPAQLEIKAPREIELGSKMQVEVKVRGSLRASQPPGVAIPNLPSLGH